MHRELEDRLEDLTVAVVTAHPDRVDPRADGWLVVPGQAVPAQHAEGARRPHGAHRMALDEGRAEGLGQHDQVALGAGRAVEHGQLVVPVEAAHQPARQPVGEPSATGQRCLAEVAAADRELGGGLPRRPVGRRFDDRTEARDPALVDRRPQGVVELGQHHLPPRLGSVEGEADLGQLLGQAPEPRRAGLVDVSHGARLPTGCSGRGRYTTCIDWYGSRVPKPTNYQMYCPIARGLEVLGDRWTLLILRDLSFGDCRFTDLRTLAGRHPPERALAAAEGPGRRGPGRDQGAASPGGPHGLHADRLRAHHRPGAAGAEPVRPAAPRTGRGRHRRAPRAGGVLGGHRLLRPGGGRRDRRALPARRRRPAASPWPHGAAARPTTSGASPTSPSPLRPGRWSTCASARSTSTRPWPTAPSAPRAASRPSATSARSSS